MLQDLTAEGTKDCGMSQAALQVLVGTALTDSAFCADLLNGKRHTLLLAFEFTDEERRFIQAVQAGSLQEFAARLDEWLQAQESSSSSWRTRGQPLPRLRFTESSSSL
jgi:hypothetical protein